MKKFGIKYQSENITVVGPFSKKTQIDEVVLDNYDFTVYVGLCKIGTREGPISTKRPLEYFQNADDISEYCSATNLPESEIKEILELLKGKID